MGLAPWRIRGERSERDRGEIRGRSGETGGDLTSSPRKVASCAKLANVDSLQSIAMLGDLKSVKVYLNNCSQLSDNLRRAFDSKDALLAALRTNEGSVEAKPEPSVARRPLSLAFPARTAAAIT